MADPSSAASARSVLLRVTLPFLAGYYVSYLYRSVNAVVGPRIALEFGLSAGELGLLTSVFFLAFAVFQPPLGLLLDRYGPRRVNAMLFLVAASGALCFALAHSVAGLAAGRALIGLGVSGALMAAFSAFALWYPPARLSSINGVAFAVGMLGAMTVTLPLELVLHVLHWREVFFVIAAVTVLVSAGLWWFVPERAGAARSASLAAQWREFAAILGDAAFRRIALCIATSQAAAVSLLTLWAATWLRDVAGYSREAVAMALLAFAGAMMFGYLGFGRAADGRVRRGRSVLPLLALGGAGTSLSLLLVVLGAWRALPGLLPVLWCIFYFCAASAVLGYSLLTRAYPKSMTGRVNTAVNVFGFIGMFTGQWAVGLILNLWPQTPGGYAAEAYFWALGALWLAQSAGAAWLWHGRRHFPGTRAAT